MSIKVSISCTSFNQEKYIEQALESLLMQDTNFKYEILINDDASTDSSAEIIRRYEKKYPDIIKPIYQSENQYSQGKEVHYTFNYTRAKGKYIAYCDGDDYWTDPYKLQKQFDFMETHPQLSACVHTGKNINEEGTRILGIQRLEKSNCYLNTERIISSQGKFISTSLFMKNIFTDDFSMPEWFNEAKITDYPLYLILSTIGDFYYMDEVMCAHRVASEGSWTQLVFNDPEERKRHIFDMIDLLESFNAHTDYIYAKNIKNQIKHNQIGYVMTNKHLKKTNPEDFNRLYNLLPLKNKIKLNMLLYMPSSVNFYQKLKNNPLREFLKPKEVFTVKERQKT